MEAAYPAGASLGTETVLSGAAVIVPSGRLPVLLTVVPGLGLPVGTGRVPVASISVLLRTLPVPAGRLSVPLNALLVPAVPMGVGRFLVASTVVLFSAMPVLVGRSPKTVATVPDPMLLAATVRLPVGKKPVPEAGKPVPHGVVTAVPAGPVTIMVSATVRVPSLELKNGKGIVVPADGAIVGALSTSEPVKVEVLEATVVVKVALALSVPVVVDVPFLASQTKLLTALASTPSPGKELSSS